MSLHHRLSAMSRSLPSVLLALVAGSSFGCARTEHATAARATATAPTVTPAPAAVDPAPAPLDAQTHGFELGKFYGYRLKLTSTIALATGPNAYDFDLTGNVGLMPVQVSAESVTLHVSIPDAAIVSRIPGSEPEFERIAKELRGTGAFFTLKGGLVSELRVPPGQAPMVSTIYREVAAALEFARAADGRSSYTATEYDTSGRYLARYDLEPSNGSWQKQKLKYFEVLGAQDVGPNRPAPVPAVTSKSQMRLEPSGRPESVVQNERLTFNSAQMPVTSALSLELFATGEQAAQPNQERLAKLLDGTHPVAASEPLGVMPSPASLDSARIGSLNFEQILTELEKIADAQAATKAKADANPSDDAEPLSDDEKATAEKQLKDDSQLFFALSSLIRQKPGTVGKIVAAVRRKSSASFTLLDALSSSSSPEALNALAALIKTKSLPPLLHGRAINALARTPTPTAASITALKALLETDPFDRKAIYGLGTYSRRLRDADKQKEAAALGEFLVARLPLAKVPLDLVTVLRGIANSGYAPALPKVVPYLSDDRDKVRVAAVRALQSMHDPQVDGILAARMRTDTSNKVRVSAIVAAQVRKPSDELASGLATAGMAASDPTVRYRAVELMVRWLPERPELRATLEQVAQKDTEARVREFAKAAL
jgi:hypothetical protein